MNTDLFRITRTVVLNKGEGRALKAGGLWVYDNEIASVTGGGENGALAAVKDFDGYPLGIGVYNENSTIRVRMLCRRPQTEVTEEFLRERVRAAWEYRRKTVDTSACRVVFGEADWLPGIVIDKFSDVLVIQSLSLGMDRFKELILDELSKLLAADGMPVRGIYERSDAKVRELEGMQQKKGFLSEPFDTDVEITENGVRYHVDVVNGQKTGFFLDQKYNRAAVGRLCNGAKVLDCFTHTGSFALNAGISGAASVLGVDASETAIKQAEANAKLNGLEDRVKFQVADVFDLLPKLAEEGEKYDVVILDPPAFTKSRTATKQAIKGYREINLRGMKLVKNGGYLATCSCSHFMTPELFRDTIAQAASGAHVRLRQVEYRTQAADHPILWSADESYYLKFYLFQVVEEK